MDKIHVLLNKHKSTQLTHLVSSYFFFFSSKDKQRNGFPGRGFFKNPLLCTCICALKLWKEKRSSFESINFYKPIKNAKAVQTSQKAKLLLLRGRTPFAKLTLLCSANKGLCKVSKASQFYWKEHTTANQLTSEVSSLKFKNGITKTYVDLTLCDIQSDALTTARTRLGYFQSIPLRLIIKLLNKRLTTAISSWTPAKFWSSRMQILKELAERFSIHTEAASCFMPDL